jgi:hypothetical protein
MENKLQFVLYWIWQYYTVIKLVLIQHLVYNRILYNPYNELFKTFPNLVNTLYTQK